MPVQHRPEDVRHPADLPHGIQAVTTGMSGQRVVYSDEANA